MLFSLLADLVLLLHLAFIVFVVFGALLAWRWRLVLFLHLPAALWGAWIELSGGICPLTPLEQEMRLRAGGAGYQGGFVEHYLVPLIYPHWLSRPTQLTLGLFVVTINLVLYGLLFRRWRRPDRQDH